MRHKIIIAMMALMSTSVMAGEPMRMLLWEDKKPQFESTLKVAQSVDEQGFVANVSLAEMFVYVADKKCNTGKAVVICPGGAYYGVSMESEGRAFAELLAQNGVTAAVLKYRMPNGVHQVPIEDATRAFEIMQQNADRWGFDADKIGVMGFSAGGHLASTMAVRLNPAFAVLFYPVVSAKNGVAHEGSFDSLTGGDLELKHYYSNELHVTPKTPETLIFHCADDNAVPLQNSELFKNALIDNGVLVEMVVFPTGGHGWGMKTDFKYHNKMKSILINFLTQIVD